MQISFGGVFFSLPLSFAEPFFSFLPLREIHVCVLFIYWNPHFLTMVPSELTEPEYKSASFNLSCSFLMLIFSSMISLQISVLTSSETPVMVFFRFFNSPLGGGSCCSSFNLYIQASEIPGSREYAIGMMLNIERNYFTCCLGNQFFNIQFSLIFVLVLWLSLWI